MKIMCDCGNIEEFNTIDEETGEQTPVREDEGQYATIEKFDFWETHDQVGIVCKNAVKLFGYLHKIFKVTMTK